MSRHHPHGESRKERRYQRIVGTGVCMVFFLLISNLALGTALLRAQTDHHNSSAQNQSTIIALIKANDAKTRVIKQETAAFAAYHAQTLGILNQIAALNSEFTQSVGMIPGITQSLTAGQNALIAKLNDIDSRVDALCANLPSTVCPAS